MPRDSRVYLEYFGVDVDILWDVIHNKLEAVEGAVTALRRE
jgi:uncharacterized protein with HEPN domain